MSFGVCSLQGAITIPSSKIPCPKMAPIYPAINVQVTSTGLWFWNGILNVELQTIRKGFPESSFLFHLCFRWKRKLHFQDGHWFLIHGGGTQIQSWFFLFLVLISRVQVGLTRFCPHCLVWWHWPPFCPAMKPLSQDRHSPPPAAADHHSYSTHWSGVKEKEGRKIISTSTVSRLFRMIQHTFITIESWSKIPTQRNGTEKAAQK